MSVIKSANTLLRNGYQVIPINSKGEPLVKGFLLDTTTYTERDASEWEKRFQGAGLALVAGKNDVYVLDFDIDNVSVARAMRKIIQKKWPTMPVRTCNHPRFAIIFRAHPSLKEISNGHSDGFKIDGTLNQIELIGKRLLTLHGKHRKTKKPYRWMRETPLRTHVKDLPILTLSHVTKLFTYYTKKQSFTGAKKVTNSTLSKHISKTTFENVQTQRKYSHNELMDALDNSNGDTRKMWIYVGTVIHNYYNGSKEGLDVWDEWSSRFDGYVDKEDCRKNYSGFRVDGGSTVGSLLNIIKKLKKTPDSPEGQLENVIKNLVYIEKTNQIGNLDRSVGESLLPYLHAKNSYANVFVERDVKDGRSKMDVTKMVNIFDIWWRHEDRKKAHAVDYVPMNNRLISPSHWNDSRQMHYYNAYVPPSVQISLHTDLVHYFIDHMKHLFPNKSYGDGQPTNFEIAMNWFAQIVQEPWERHRVALYSICTSHGMGRGWLVNLNNLLFGTDNVSTIPTMDEIIKPNGKNGYLYRTVLLNVNEVSCSGKDRFRISDRLKTLLSDDKQAIDIKWGEQNYGVQIYTRMFAQANNVGDMVIDEDDTRFTVCINRSSPKSKSYYVQLYKLLNKETYPDFLNQVYTYLMNYKVTLDWLQEAPMTQDKITVIRSSKSETALAFYEFKILVGKNIFTTPQLHSFLSTHASLITDNEMGGNLNHNQLNYISREQLRLSKNINVDNNIINVNSFYNHDLKQLGKEKIKRSINKVNNLIKNYFNTGEKHE